MESTKQPLNSTTLGRPSGELVLRITGNSAQAETVRVRTAKCSVGSADACSIRLNGAGIQPVHCIILRGAKRTIVRKWADGVWLNGKAFTDSTLAVGDAITISEVRLEVVSDERTSSAADVQRQVTLAESKVEQLSEQARRLNARIRELEGDKAGKQGGPQDDLLLRLARLQDEKQELERRIAAQSVRHLDERRQWSCDLERLQAQVAKVDDFKLDRQAIRAEEEALRAEVESLRNQMQSQQTDFEAQRTESQQQAAEASNAAAAVSEDVARRLEELESRQNQFEDDARQFRDEQEASRQALEQRSQELDAVAEELAGQSKRLDEQTSALETKTGELDARAEAFAAEQREAASLAEPTQFGELDLTDEADAAGDFNFPSQLRLEEADDGPVGSAASFNSTEQDECDAESELSSSDEASADLPAYESEQDESFELLHAEISSLINDEVTEVDAESTESDDLASDDLMDYASQVASEVRGQVIDQQAVAEDSVYGEGSQFDNNDLTYSDAPFVDSSELLHESNEIVEEESSGETPLTEASDAEAAPFPATEGLADDSSPFHAQLDDTNNASTAGSSMGGPAETDSQRFFSDDLIGEVGEEQQDDAANIDPSCLTNALDAGETSAAAELHFETADVERTETGEVFDGLSKMQPAMSSLNAGEEPEQEASPDDVADEMLSRLQAMVGADTGPSPSLEADAPTESHDTAMENRLDVDAESLLSELQSLDASQESASLDSPVESATASPDDMAPSARDDAMLAELMRLSSPAPVADGGELTAEEVQYEAVEPANADRLETASLLEKYQIDEVDETPVAPVATAVADSSNADADSSIEDYMQQLMQRVGNGPQASANAVPQEDEAVAAEEAAEKAKPVRTPARPSLPVDSLTKMRELANESARSAIKRHADTSSRANAFTNLCFLGISLLAAAIFFVLSEGTSLIWLLPGLIASGVSILFAYRAVRGAIDERAAGTVERPKNNVPPGAPVMSPAGLNDAVSAPQASELAATGGHFAAGGAELAEQQAMPDASASPYPFLLAHQPPAGQTQYTQPVVGQFQPPADPSQTMPTGYPAPGYAQQQQQPFGIDPQAAGQPQYPQAGYAMPQQPGQPAYDHQGQPISQPGYLGDVHPQALQPNVGYGQVAPTAVTDPNSIASGYAQPLAPPAHNADLPTTPHPQDPLAAFGPQSTPTQNYPS